MCYLVTCAIWLYSTSIPLLPSLPVPSRITPSTQYQHSMFQAVVLKVGGSSDKEEGEKERTQGGGTGADWVGNSTVSTTSDVRQEAFVRDRRRHAASPPLLTCDGVCLAEVGPEGSPTYVPQVIVGTFCRDALVTGPGSAGFWVWGRFSFYFRCSCYWMMPPGK